MRQLDLHIIRAKTCHLQQKWRENRRGFFKKYSHTKLSNNWILPPIHIQHSGKAFIYPEESTHIHPLPRQDQHCQLCEKQDAHQIGRNQELSVTTCSSSFSPPNEKVFSCRVLVLGKFNNTPVQKALNTRLCVRF